MTRLNLKTVDNQQVSWNIDEYKTNSRNVVLSFGVHFDDGSNNVFFLVPKRTHHQQHTFVKTVVDALSAESGYSLGSSKGVGKGLLGAGIGLLVGVAAGIVLDSFDEDVVDDGDYYDRHGRLVFRGLITLGSRG